MTQATERKDRTLYRTMFDQADGKPEVGRSADKLGVRIEAPRPRGKPDMTVGDDGRVRPGLKPEGMSVQIDDPRDAMPHRLPPELGGSSRGVLYELDEAKLPVLLEVRSDHGHHAVIRPRRECSLAEYEEALSSTQSAWRPTDVTRFPRLPSKPR